jgi:methylated-DNA-[protein]-cysteine S-methyltransferase
MLKILKRTEAGKERKAHSYCAIKSPIGELRLAADDTALTGLYFAGCKHIPATRKQWTLDARHPVLLEAAKQLGEYFAGKRATFSLPLRLVGTDFQERVWNEIALIPHGETVSYSELAKRAGKPLAIRAAGTSTGRNPISIIIPCHRVMGKNGGLHGFAGGLDRKRRLLGIENQDAIQ